MNALIQKALFTEPIGPLWRWRYVKLGSAIILLIIVGWMDLGRSDSSLYVRYEHVLVMLMVLFIFLTTDFRWHRSIFVALRIGVFISMLLVCISLWYSVVLSSAR